MDFKELNEKIKSKVSIVISSATSAFERLNDRDRKIVTVFASVLVLLILIGIIAKGHRSLNNLRDDIESAKSDLKSVQTLLTQYNTNKEKIAFIEKRLGTGRLNITTYLDNLARQNNIRLVSLQEVSVEQGQHYKESAAKGTIADISIRKLVHFFYLIENGSQIMEIKRLKIKPKYKSPEYLEVSFFVSTYDQL